MNEPDTRLRNRLAWALVATAVVAACATLLVFALRDNIATRQREARTTSLRVVPLDETSVDAATWGKNFPRQYDGYSRTIERSGTKYGGGGSEALAKSRLEEDPRLVKIFDGYAFSIDFRSRRGHAYMLDDQRATKRVTERPQPGSCVHCHASNTVAYRKLGVETGAPGTLEAPFTSPEGQAQLMKGFEEMGKLPYAEATAKVAHPVGCIDCHDPEGLQLRVTKPGFLRGIAALAAGEAKVPHLPSIEKWRTGGRAEAYDPNRDASRQELRSMVCGQCHVEYYCGPKTTLFFPWKNGLKVEDIEATYADFTFPDGHKFYDWKHAATGAEVLKAQHPEFEMWSQGVHARSGVACADCHMPYVREGALKVSDHHVRSPLLDVSRACQTCHRFPEAEMRARVEIIQDRTHALMGRAEDALVQLIDEVAAARRQGLDDAKLAPVHALQRAAQWRLDFVNAENSMGFHAPQEAARILAESIDDARKAELALRDAQAAK